ncbi:CopG family ribbon-helix-helix protein [Pseudomonas sp. PDM13]|uniref:CopG family ribbon-helix-helix protein n=1 Tax=Pseudomonas sp. PDM13 TaxID=2769255 RepID=UPI0021DF5E25|nr:hypothetical protein [Pseudomonas sp. PDM13]MCU9951619.1 hypothetical protein [Pseudomonas sp. PDM13]
MSFVSLNISEKVVQYLASLAEATGRSEDSLTEEALSQYLRREAWQLTETERALKEADAGDFASDEEVQSVLEKWSCNAY